MDDLSARTASDTPDRVRPEKALRIGILVPGTPNRFFDKITAGMRSILAGDDRPHQLFLAPTDYSKPDDTAVLDSLVGARLDALVVIAPRLQPEQLEDVATRMPVVMIGRHDRSPHYDTVEGDDETGARLAMTHLLDAGHTEIAHLTHEDVIAGVEPRTPHAVRLWAYEESLRDRGLGAHARILRCDSGEDSAYGVVRQLLTAGHRPTAIFAAHDQLAMGVLRALADAGLGREDLAVVGYDNIKISAHPLIALTSIDQDGEEMGRQAAELVLDRLAGRRDAVHFRTEVTLVVRASSTGVRDRFSHDR